MREMREHRQHAARGKNAAGQTPLIAEKREYLIGKHRSTVFLVAAGQKNSRCTDTAHDRRSGTSAIKDSIHEIGTDVNPRPTRKNME